MAPAIIKNRNSDPRAARPSPSEWYPRILYALHRDIAGIHPTPIYVYFELRPNNKAFLMWATCPLGPPLRNKPQNVLFNDLNPEPGVTREWVKWLEGCNNDPKIVPILARYLVQNKFGEDANIFQDLDSDTSEANQNFIGRFSLRKLSQHDGTRFDFDYGWPATCDYDNREPQAILDDWKHWENQYALERSILRGDRTMVSPVKKAFRDVYGADIREKDVRKANLEALRYNIAPLDSTRIERALRNQLHEASETGEIILLDPSTMHEQPEVGPRLPHFLNHTTASGGKDSDDNSKKRKRNIVEVEDDESTAHLNRLARVKRQANYISTAISDLQTEHTKLQDETTRTRAQYTQLLQSEQDLLASIHPPEKLSEDEFDDLYQKYALLQNKKTAMDIKFTLMDARMMDFQKRFKDRFTDASAEVLGLCRELDEMEKPSRQFLGGSQDDSQDVSTDSDTLVEEDSDETE
ncbi:hypothetical protein G7Y89_g14525 [Cudoniella acicularis]|uniref:Uncharacterized protein n=1 Tax=Cudoniella acicularis TaxID=354080 RepID=A0A8H4VTG7_9HELO|nr:hypothetical protein G7Y89_g14525 [Cudoniella acicularis]